MSLLYSCFLVFLTTPSKGQAIVFLLYQVSGQERPDLIF